MLRTPLAGSMLPFALLFAAACAGAGPAPTLPAPAPVPAAGAPEPESADAGHEGAERDDAPREDLLGDTRYDLPVVANPWVQRELDFLVGERKETIGRWMQRGERYRAWVEGVFAGYGLPRDLYHLAMVESGYTPTARSRAGAVGMWQFMPATGRGMGLRIDELVDERMDPVRSTHAAARHLRDLHRAFGGDWALAAAAYNAGSGRISRGLGRFGATDFWTLAERGDLAQETRIYVPRLFAVTIIARDPERFGYELPRGTVPPFTYDSVRVDVPTPLSELARLAGVTAEGLEELNPHLVQGMAPANYWVWTPAGSGRAAQLAFDSSGFRREGGLDYYTLRRGETVAAVARHTGLEMDRIRDLNLSRRVERMGRGDRVRLPAPAVRLLETRRTDRVAAADTPAPRSSRTRAARPAPRAEPARREESEPTARTASAPGSHTVASGETLWGIARRFDVTVRELREANELAEDEPIQPGQALRIPGTAAAPPTPAAAPRRHTVAAGETLWSLARRYETSVEALRAANALDEDAPIRTGQELRIPAR